MGRALGCLVLVLAFALAGCGGDRPSDEEIAREVVEELSTLDAGPGPGEGGGRPLKAGWRTDFDRRAVPLSEFQSGGPGKDGIPAIDDPSFVGVDEADFLEPREPVIQLELGAQARAYPLQILVWHEIVNDEVAGTPVAVTFCPLCYTALVFDRRAAGRTLDFGTTGNLRDSDLVMYDRQTESWWQQFGGVALVGELTGTRLEPLPAPIVAWERFRADHPDGLVLSRDTGFRKPYGQNPYFGYDDVDSPPYFSTRHSDDTRLAPKERVAFVELEGEAVAVPFSVLRQREVVRVRVAGRDLVVRWRPGVASALDRGEVAEGRNVGTAEVREDGRLVPFSEPYWFAVAAFRPETRIVRG